MDSPTSSAFQDLDTPMHSQSKQDEWVRVGVSNLSMRNGQSYESAYHPQGTAPRRSVYHRNTPVPTLSQNYGAPGSFQQGNHDTEEEEIEAYIHIPCVKKLYDVHCGLAKTVTRLYEEASELRERVDWLEKERAESPWMLEGPLTRNYATFQRTISGSLAPSDSLSQRPSKESSGSFESREGNSRLRLPGTRPPLRPSEFPVAILWQKDDCKHDTFGAQPLKSNSGHPRMNYAIREPDGTVIEKGYFKAIQKSATNLAATLIQEEEEQRRGPLPLKKMTKSFFESERPKQWLNAIAVIEEAYPILTYAATHWKAEQLLVMQLTTRRTYLKKASGKVDEDAGDEDDEDEDEGDEDEDGKSKVPITTGLKRKRPPHTSYRNEDEETSEGGSRVNVATASKRKRGLSASKPPEKPATAAQDTTMEIDLDSHETLAIAAKKRLGKQAAFAAISAAALSIGGTPSEPTSVRQPRVSPASLISVDATYDGLKDVFTMTFRKNMPPNAIELLDVLEKISGSASLDSSTPSSTVIEFIECIESADPTALGIDEDETNIGWGHSQFTSGGMKCSNVLLSWPDIGNVKTAYRLLAASLKTGLVARHLCFANNISVSDSSYLSDAYLRKVVEILWNLRAQDTVFTPLAAAGQHASTAAAVATMKISSTKPALTTTSREPQELNEGPIQLDRLRTDELKAWMSEHSILLGTHTKWKKKW